MNGICETRPRGGTSITQRSCKNNFVERKEVIKTETWTVSHFVKSSRFLITCFLNFC